MIRGRRKKIKSLFWDYRHQDQQTPGSALEKKRAMGRVLWRSLHDQKHKLSLPVLQFLDIQYKEKPVGFRFPRHAHSRFFEFYYVDRGNITLRVRDRKMRLEDGQGMLFPPGWHHEVLGDLTAATNVLTIHFQSPDLLRKLPPLKGLAGKTLALGPQAKDHLRPLFERLNRGEPFSSLQAGVGFLQFLLFLVEGQVPEPESGSTRKGSFSPFAGKVEGIIRQNVEKRLTLSFLAEQVGVSLSGLAHRYREGAGETVKQAILRCRVERAKQILRAREFSVKEAAHRTGFTSSSALSTAFRKQEGMTPGEYQRSLVSSMGKTPH